MGEVGGQYFTSVELPLNVTSLNMCYYACVNCSKWSSATLFIAYVLHIFGWVSIGSLVNDINMFTW